MLLPGIEERLVTFAPLPHWGKVFTLAPEQVRAQYRRLPDFLALRDWLAPDRAFTNAYVCSGSDRALAPAPARCRPLPTRHLGASNVPGQSNPVSRHGQPQPSQKTTRLDTV